MQFIPSRCGHRRNGGQSGHYTCKHKRHRRHSRGSITLQGENCSILLTVSPLHSYAASVISSMFTCVMSPLSTISPMSTATERLRPHPLVIIWRRCRHKSDTNLVTNKNIEKIARFRPTIRRFLLELHTSLFRAESRPIFGPGHINLRTTDKV